MKKKIFLIVAVCFLLTGVAVLLYPWVSKCLYSRRMESVTDDFIKKWNLSLENSNGDEDKLREEEGTIKTEEIDGQPSTSDDEWLEYESESSPSDSQHSKSDAEHLGEDSQSLEPDDQSSQPDSVQLAALYKHFLDYNQNLIENGQSSFGDPFVYEDDAVDLSAYGINDGMAGVLCISKIGLKLPIYLGATKSNMAQGAVHLNRTSLPIGGESTNAVIAGHTGWARAVMFDNITQLEPGDSIFIINYWNTLEYVVRETKIVERYSHSEICIEKGADLVTLMTCYPSGVNSHRYLVICERK